MFMHMSPTWANRGSSPKASSVGHHGRSTGSQLASQLSPSTDCMAHRLYQLSRMRGQGVAHSGKCVAGASQVHGGPAGLGYTAGTGRLCAVGAQVG